MTCVNEAITAARARLRNHSMPVEEPYRALDVPERTNPLPAENAVVLCVDEKSQIQALDRTAPMLPMQPGRARRAGRDLGRGHLRSGPHPWRS